MLVTKTPVRESMSFLEFSQSGCRCCRTVSSGNCVVENISKLETSVSGARRHCTIVNSRPWSQAEERECRMLPEVASTTLTAMNSTRLIRSSLSSIRASFSRPPRLFASITTATPYDGPPVPPTWSPFSQPQPTNPSSKGPPEINQFNLHVHSTRNNTIVTFTNQDKNPIACWSGGTCGFKKVNRASYEAGYQCTVRAFEKILSYREEVGPFSLEIVFKGFGQGRDAMQKALLASEGEKIRPFVSRLTDKTPVKIGGTRAKKARRL